MAFSEGNNECKTAAEVQESSSSGDASILPVPRSPVPGSSSSSMTTPTQADGGAAKIHIHDLSASSKTPIISAESLTMTVKFPSVCRDGQQFQNWQKSRPWLVMAPTGSVKCATCAEVKKLGLHASSGQHEGTAFVEGTVMDCLLKKIDKHRDSGTHKKCKDILDTREEDSIRESLRASQSLFEERHKDNIETTQKIFCTAYECAKSQLPFAEPPRLVDLQDLNGVSCGNMLFSDHSFASIVEYVGSEMRSEIISYIIKSK